MSYSATPWTVACQAPRSSTISWSLLRFISLESVMPHNHLNLCCPLLLLSSNFPDIKVFQWVDSSNQVAKYWSFSFSNSLSMNIQGWFPLGVTGLISLLSKGLSSAMIQKHEFFGAEPSLWTSSHICTWFHWKWKSESISCSVMSNSLGPHGL